MNKALLRAYLMQQGVIPQAAVMGGMDHGLSPDMPKLAALEGPSPMPEMPMSRAPAPEFDFSGGGVPADIGLDMGFGDLGLGGPVLDEEELLLLQGMR